MIFPRQQHSIRGITLIEIITVVGISLILVALILGPAVKVLRSNVASAGCMSNLRQLGTAFYAFAADHNGEFPAITGDAGADTDDAKNGKGDQWDNQLSRYLDIPVNRTKAPLRKTAYFCPASQPDPSYANKPVVLLSYTYNVNLGKTESSPGMKVGSIQNGSTIVMLADLELVNSTKDKSYVPQTGQGRNNTIVFRPIASWFKYLAARHDNRMNILFVDGHVASRKRIDPKNPSSPPENVRWTAEGDLTSVN